MDNRRTNVVCPFCGQKNLDVWLDAPKHECPTCKGVYAVEIRVSYVSVPFTRDEAQVMIACQGLGYEAGFSESELAIAQELLSHGFLEHVSYGGKRVLGRTAWGDACLANQSG